MILYGLWQVADPKSVIRVLCGKTATRKAGEVKTLALAYVNALESKIDELTSMIGALRKLVEYCQGDQRPESPIPEGLSDTTTPAISTARPTLLKR